MKCPACGGEHGEGAVCQYCFSRASPSDECFNLVVAGSMNDVFIVAGNNRYDDTMIKGSMGTFTYRTSQAVVLTLKGSMNTVTFRGVKYTVKESGGSMNDICEEHA